EQDSGYMPLLCHRALPEHRDNGSCLVPNDKLTGRGGWNGPVPRNAGCAPAVRCSAGFGWTHVYSREHSWLHPLEREQARLLARPAKLLREAVQTLGKHQGVSLDPVDPKDDLSFVAARHLDGL